MSGFWTGIVTILAVNVVFAYGIYLAVATGQLNLGGAGGAGGRALRACLLRCGDPGLRRLAVDLRPARRPAGGRILFNGRDLTVQGEPALAAFDIAVAEINAAGLVDDSPHGWRLTEDETKRFSRLLEAIKAAGLPAKTAEIVYVSDEVVSNTAGVKLYPPLMEAAGVADDPEKLEEERAAIATAMEGVRFSGVVGDDICFAGHDAELPGCVIEIRGGQWTKFAEAAADACE
ncbi:MAG: hypothetical protein VYD87_04050 [Pseudomonadota bacterium]|nr:hypothetical protein [Pseudomonadota bacterium]MEE3101195.1 hypothetical protein [Pseudomonadota bacterium]